MTEKQNEPRLSKKPKRPNLSKPVSPPGVMPPEEKPPAPPSVDLRKDLSADVSPDVRALEKQYGLPSKDELARMKTERKPFGSMVQKLHWDELPGWKLHWFNDEAGRILDADKHGYCHILDKDGKKVKRVVGTRSDGHGALEAFLMALPMEWYLENQDAESALHRQFDKDLRKGRVAGEPGEDGRYVPKDPDTDRSRIVVEDQTGARKLET